MSSKKKDRAPELLKLNFSEPSSETRAILDECHHYIKGQDRALEYIVDALEVFKAGMRNPEKPISVMLFLGPSGVGKTRVSEVLARCLFGDFKAFTKVRSPEFAHGHEVSRLTGSPPGYIGYTEDPLKLPLSQFNIDKFDLIHGLKTGKLMEDLAVENARYQVVRFRYKEELKKDYEKLKQRLNPDEDTKKKLDELRKEIVRMEKTIRDSDDYYRWLADFTKIHGAESLSSAVLMDIYEKCGGSMKFNSIILFDEIEKAHEDFRRHLLEIMDRGSLGVGDQVTSFKNSFIFMTSNIGSKEISRILEGERSGIGFKQGVASQAEPANLDKEIYKAAVAAAEDFFTPEFLGRVDKIVVFRPLTKLIMSEIFDLELENFNQRNITQAILPVIVRFTEAAKNSVLEAAMQHSSYGARMIEKKLDRTLKVGLARLMNQKENPIVPGDVLWIDLEDKELVFKKEIIDKNKPNGGNPPTIISH